MFHYIIIILLLHIYILTATSYHTVGLIISIFISVRDKYIDLLPNIKSRSKRNTETLKDILYEYNVYVESSMP